MKWHPSMSILAVSALTVPMLSPCTFGLGTVGSEMMNKASARINPSNANSHLPTAQLRKWAAKPGPALTILDHQTIPRNRLVTDGELVNARHSSRAPASVGRGAAGLVQSLSDILALSDITTAMVLSGDSEPALESMTHHARHENRQQLILQEQPFVILQGTTVAYHGETSNRPSIARADGRAKLTVISSEGTYMALANHIHFRAATNELILEGNPSVLSGEQYIKTDTATALVRLNVLTRTVSLSGGAKLRVL